MDHRINNEGLFVPTVLETPDNGSYFLVVPKSNPEEAIKQECTNNNNHINHHQLLLPKTHIYQYIENTQQQQQLDKNAFQQQRPKPRRDDKRRANHNEIERRRRDKISTWISQLGLLLPVPSHNKNEVCEYVTELKTEHSKMSKKFTEFSNVKESLRRLEQEVSEGLEENSMLKDELLKCGFQLEQVSVPEAASQQEETTYLVFDSNDNNRKLNGNEEEDGGGGDDDGVMQNDIDNYFQS